jgi:hypothetical protein
MDIQEALLLQLLRTSSPQAGLGQPLGRSA